MDCTYPCAAIAGRSCLPAPDSAQDGRRRELGLGKLKRAAPDAPQTDLKVIESHLNRTRAVAAALRDRIRVGADPVAERVAARAAEKENAATRASTAKAVRATLRRVARDFHETDAAIQALTPKHRAQWIASIENGLSATLLDTPIGDVTAPLLLVELQLVVCRHTRDRPSGAAAPAERFRSRAIHRLDGTTPPPPARRNSRRSGCAGSIAPCRMPKCPRSCVR